MTKIVYWCPFISEVATVSSVINSVVSLKKFSKNTLHPCIIDVVGEWERKKEDLKKDNIEIINLNNTKIINKLPTKGFIWSRLTYIIISFFSIIKLHKFLTKNNPDFLVIHLISSIPLILLILFKYKTKFILRISGFPILNRARSFFWKLTNGKLYAITAPTLKLLKKNVFDEKKLWYLPDPVIRIKKICEDLKNQNQLVEKNFSVDNTLLSIGRLTHQKNFEFLIDAFYEINKIYPKLNLFIIGQGEKKKLLLKKIITKKLENKVFLLGFKKNIFKYLEKCKLFILTSRYEDPGFVILEAGYMNKTVLSSDCPNGPLELINNEENGYLYKENSIKEFVISFKRLVADKYSLKFQKQINLKKKCKEFTLFNHYQKFKKILINEN